MKFNVQVNQERRKEWSGVFPSKSSEVAMAEERQINELIETEFELHHRRKNFVG
jgi:hypothetical protein